MCSRCAVGGILQDAETDLQDMYQLWTVISEPAASDCMLIDGSRPLVFACDQPDAQGGVRDVMCLVGP
jgi:hypothetical protein